MELDRFVVTLPLPGSTHQDAGSSNCYAVIPAIDRASGLQVEFRVYAPYHDLALQIRDQLAGSMALLPVEPEPTLRSVLFNR